eukprot:6888153-Pyramimonas_sp.AAC.1
MDHHPSPRSSPPLARVPPHRGGGGARCALRAERPSPSSREPPDSSDSSPKFDNSGARWSWAAPPLAPCEDSRNLTLIIYEYDGAFSFDLQEALGEVGQAVVDDAGEHSDNEAGPQRHGGAPRSHRHQPSEDPVEDHGDVEDPAPPPGAGEKGIK